MRQVFVDLDGVLADFDGAYETLYGVRPDRTVKPDKQFWVNIASAPLFFRTLPVMPDAHALMDGVRKFHPAPIILTGLPHSIVTVADEKRAWVEEHFPGTPVVTGLSRDKRDHGKPGDILIDDWVKYRHLWEAMGGVFILHTSAERTLAELATLYEATS